MSTKLIWYSSNFLILLKMTFYLVSMIDPLSTLYSELQWLQIYEFVPFCIVTWRDGARLGSLTIISSIWWIFFLNNGKLKKKHCTFFSNRLTTYTIKRLGNFLYNGISCRFIKMYPKFDHNFTVLLVLNKEIRWEESSLGAIEVGSSGVIFWAKIFIERYKGSSGVIFWSNPLQIYLGEFIILCIVRKQHSNHNDRRTCVKFSTLYNCHIIFALPIHQIICRNVAYQCCTKMIHDTIFIFLTDIIQFKRVELLNKASQISMLLVMARCYYF